MRNRWAAYIPEGLARPVVEDGGEDLLVEATQQLPSAAAPADGHGLLHRFDTKYALPVGTVTGLLPGLAGDYRVLLAGNELLARYFTVYFDTLEWRFLRDHLRGKRPRHKVRIRHYADRQVSFLEIKAKTNGDRTLKDRRPVPFGCSELSAADCEWIAARLAIGEVPRPVAWTSCKRLTLLGNHGAERATIDIDVQLGSARGVRTLSQQALLELKQPHPDRQSVLAQGLRAVRATPVRLSKYVAAMMGVTAPLPAAHFRAALGRLARPEFWEECAA